MPGLLVPTGQFYKADMWKSCNLGMVKNTDLTDPSFQLENTLSI